MSYTNRAGPHPDDASREVAKHTHSGQTHPAAQEAWAMVSKRFAEGLAYLDTLSRADTAFDKVVTKQQYE